MSRFFIIIFMLSVFFISTPIFAQQEEKPIFKSKTGYDIYYEVSPFEVDRIEQVQVLGLTKINDISFLILKGASLSYQDETGYIPFNQIRAILPSGFMRPERTFDQDNKRR